MMLDIARASTRSGIDAWFDITRWLQGKIEIAPQAASLYGELVVRLIGAQRGTSKKCLVLDLDNTLWGGVVGDDGLDGIVLGQGSAVGEAHLALQRFALSLRERGIILAVCSKNEQEIAEAVFADHPEMLIKRSDIAAFVANWNDKAENLKIIADQLNIGLDSLVFADDNPVERARIRESLPMVAVPELSADPAHYVRCIADAGYFESVGFTAEDQQRAGQYAANASREALHTDAHSMDDFLRGLDMYVSCGPVTSVDLPRATQLINKTNQFNTTTRRYTAEEMSKLAADPDNIMLHFRLIDRFGDNGVVSIMIMCRDPVDADVLNINNWVMSCRVFGRQLEDEVMNIAVQKAKDERFKRMSADYIPTQKNGVIKGLYEKLEFSRAEKSRSDSGAIRWTLDLDDYSFRTTFITHKAQ
jgi:FkbH-like protein